MRNKSLIHTKDVKTQEGTPLHLEYYLLPFSPPAFVKSPMYPLA